MFLDDLDSLLMRCARKLPPDDDADAYLVVACAVVGMFLVFGCWLGLL